MAITFENLATTIPGWVANIHQRQPLSYAYRSGNSLVSIYGANAGLFGLSSGLTVSERTDADLNAWATTTFAGQDLRPMQRQPGHAVQGVWRPGLYYTAQVNQALGVTDADRLSAEQALHLLLERLYDLFLYVQPTAQGLQSFGHKSRELLILAATEVENYWQRHARDAGLTGNGGRSLKTTDYVRLKEPLFPAEYEVTLTPFASLAPIRPFASWSAQNPTQSLPWYDAYNKTKHDRDSHFNDASVERCIQAVCAAIILYCVRFGPFSLVEGTSITSSQFKQLFSIALATPDTTSFYIPSIDLTDRRPDLVCGDGGGSAMGDGSANSLIDGDVYCRPSNLRPELFRIRYVACMVGSRRLTQFPTSGLARRLPNNGIIRVTDEFWQCLPPVMEKKP
ncbi:hypothetical protein [Devosia sp.]|uniref:hypothetical protein n=1 Tax=Devosia sp. TaxID=1871048 RepID=UPI0025D009B0|nr:hypothetical protein [Devosia sp.]MCR6634758.1 hypothetical protein [Devosia sp.]